uniref:Major facilitator superfamily (MFS) profile domain-containing protein n=1 Tax=Photinus pyralis TaxID=7054 RepID=A0A1Y1MIE1_PHOPY
MCFSAPMKSKMTPNGGWGWMVVLGAAITNMTNQSIFSQFGLIFGEKLTEMGCGTGGAALVININSMITNFSGLVTGPILKHYSARKVTLLGIFLTASGMVLSSVATNLIELIISYSVFTGLGLGLIMPATFVAVNEYFTSRKSQAVGLSMAGTGVGQMIMPQVVRFLLDEYGYRGTTLILGALCLNGLPGALLFHVRSLRIRHKLKAPFQPVKWHMIETNTIDEEKQPLLVKHIQIPQTTTRYGVVEEPGTSSNEDKGKTLLRKVIEFFNFELLKDWVFLHLINGLALVYTCTVAFNMIYPFFLQNSVGLSRGDTALCMSLLSGADIVARVTIPMITKHFRISNRMTFLLGTVCWAVCRSVLAEQHRFSIIILLSLLCGYIRAAAVVNQNLAITEYCKDESKIPSAIGLNMVAKGLLVLGVGQFFGERTPKNLGLSDRLLSRLG